MIHQKSTVVVQDYNSSNNWIKDGHEKDSSQREYVDIQYDYVLNSVQTKRIHIIRTFAESMQTNFCTKPLGKKTAPKEDSKEATVFCIESTLY